MFNLGLKSKTKRAKSKVAKVQKEAQAYQTTGQ